MGQHTTLTPKISKISIHLGDMEVPLAIYQLSHQNMFAMSSF